jgi:GNAT superfamily N-acetyltransferase
VSAQPPIEQATVDDVEAAVRLIALVNPADLGSAAAWHHRLAVEPERAGRLMLKATVGGELVGWGTGVLDTHTTTAGVAFVAATVHPDHRGRGLGGALAAAAEAHVLGLGATVLRSTSHDDEPARRLAARHGFRNTGLLRISRVDLATLPPAPPPPDGVELRSFTEVEPEEVHRVDTLVTLDVPEDVTWDDMPYDSWLGEFWENPTLDREASMVAVVDGEAVAITMLHTDRETRRGENDITGTLQEHRGRGLARLVKHHSLQRAAALGITEVFTFNDETNAPMLAVNTSLGYRPHSTRLSWLRELG